MSSLCAQKPFKFQKTLYTLNSTATFSAISDFCHRSESSKSLVDATWGGDIEFLGTIYMIKKFGG